MDSEPIDSMRKTQAEVEALLDEICDDFEHQARKSRDPEFIALLGRVPNNLAERLCVDLLSIYEELEGHDEMLRYASGHSDLHPEHRAAIQAACERLQVQRQVHAETASVEASDNNSSDHASVNATPGISPATTASGAMDADTKPQVERYKLLQLIGEGGMGAVWMADQVEPVRRRVAIKIVKPSIDSRELVARFEAERQAVAMMDHPNIAKILDAGTTVSGQPYFAMELVKGLPLREYCDANRLNLLERVSLVRQICGGVQHAHQKGVLHRDLKPSNILVAEYNGKPVPKIIDFGLAKALEPSLQLTEQSLFTEFGQVMGSFKYMSPEQAGLDSLDIDTRTDIYSLGVILYELLIGSTPLESSSMKNLGLLQVLELIREQDSPRPSIRIETTNRQALLSIAEQRATNGNGLKQSVSGDLDWIVVKTLEKDRTRRYDTAAELSSDLACFLSGDPVSARPPTVGYRMSKFIAKRKGLVASTVLAVFLLFSGIAFSSWFAWQASLAKTAAEQSESDAVQNANRAEATLAVLLDAFQDIDPEQSGAPATAIEILRKAESGIDAAELDQRAKSNVYHTLAVSYRGLGDYRSAVRTAETCVQSRQEFYGAFDDRTKQAETELAIAFQKSGETKRAVALLQNVYAYFLENNGRRDRISLGVVDDLAGAYAANGDNTKATELYEQNLEIAKGDLPIQDPLRNQFANNLANHLFRLGETKRSLDLLKGTHRVLCAAVPADDPLRLAAGENLAVAYQHSERLSDAVPLLESVLESRRRKFGVDHPDTLSTMNNLATMYLATDQTELALDILNRTLESQRKRNSVGDRRTLRTQANIGQVYVQLENWDDAIKWLSETLQDQRTHLGEFDSDTLQTQWMLATAQLNSGDLYSGVANFEAVYSTIQGGFALQGNAAREIGAQRPRMLQLVIDQVANLIESQSIKEAIALLSALGPVNGDIESQIERLRESIAESQRSSK